MFLKMPCCDKTLIFSVKHLKIPSKNNIFPYTWNTCACTKYIFKNMNKYEYEL